MRYLGQLDELPESQGEDRMVSFIDRYEDRSSPVASTVFVVKRTACYDEVLKSWTLRGSLLFKRLGQMVFGVAYVDDNKCNDGSMWPCLGLFTASASLCGPHFKFRI